VQSPSIIATTPKKCLVTITINGVGVSFHLSTNLTSFETKFLLTSTLDGPQNAKEVGIIERFLPSCIKVTVNEKKLFSTAVKTVDNGISTTISLKVRGFSTADYNKQYTRFVTSLTLDIQLSSNETVEFVRFTPVKRFHCLWMDIPPEIRHLILESSDALTQYLNNFGKYNPERKKLFLEPADPPMILCKPTSDIRRDCIEVWKAVFDTDWEGDLDLMPYEHFPLIDEGLLLVKSHSMFIKVLESRNGKTPLEYLINIPMRHLWLEILENFQAALDFDPSSYLELAVNCAHLNYFLHLLEQTKMPKAHPKDWNRIIKSAGFFGQMDVFEYCIENGIPISRITVGICFEYGRVNVLRLLYRHGYEFPASLLKDKVVEYGNVEVVRFLHETKLAMFTPAAMNRAAGQGFLDIVKFLHRYGYRCTTNALDWAAADGHLEVVKFLHNNRFEGATTYAMDKASERGHLEVVDYLHKFRHEGCTKRAMDGASRSGHLEIVEYLHAHREEGCTVSSVMGAIRNGHLEVVEFLLLNYSENLVHLHNLLPHAVSSERLDIVQYLCEQNLTQQVSEALDRALSMSNMEIVKYLSSYLSEYDNQVANAYLHSNMLEQEEEETGETLQLKASEFEDEQIEETGVLEPGDEYTTEVLHSNACESGIEEAVDFLQSSMPQRKEAALLAALQVFIETESSEADILQYLEINDGISMISLGWLAYMGLWDVFRKLYEFVDVECQKTEDQTHDSEFENAMLVHFEHPNSFTTDTVLLPSQPPTFIAEIVPSTEDLTKTPLLLSCYDEAAPYTLKAYPFSTELDSNTYLYSHVNKPLHSDYYSTTPSCYTNPYQTMQMQDMQGEFSNKGYTYIPQQSYNGYDYDIYESRDRRYRCDNCQKDIFFAFALGLYGRGSEAPYQFAELYETFEEVMGMKILNVEYKLHDDSLVKLSWGNLKRYVGVSREEVEAYIEDVLGEYFIFRDMVF
jgi:ankyrin repeat protein